MSQKRKTFCLLGGKHGDTYIRMIYEINKGIIALGLTWKPEFVSLDFEMGAILAFIFCFPAIKTIGCWFHFGQCLFRSMNKLKMIRIKAKIEGVKLEKTIKY